MSPEMISAMNLVENSAEIPTLTHAEYLESVFGTFRELAGGRIEVEYLGSLFDTTIEEYMTMLHEILEQHWGIWQRPSARHIPSDYPIHEFDPYQYLKHYGFVEEISESIQKYFKLLQSTAEQQGIMYFTLNIIATVRFSSSVYQQVHFKETRNTLFEITWDSRTGSSDCHSQILEAFEKMLDKFMEVECLPENSGNFLCTDRYLLKECMRRFDMRTVAAE